MRVNKMNKEVNLFLERVPKVFHVEGKNASDVDGSLTRITIETDVYGMFVLDELMKSIEKYHTLDKVQKDQAKIKINIDHLFMKNKGF